MGYQEAVAYLDSLIHETPAPRQQPRREERMATMRRLLACLGEPQRSFPAFHEIGRAHV